MSGQSTAVAVAEALTEFQFPSNSSNDGAGPVSSTSISAIRAYLDQHSFLVHLLPDIRRKLRHYFSDSPVSLEIAVDPDEPKRQQLLVLVATTHSPSNAVEILGQFDREWWLANLEQAQGRICIDVQFK